MRQHQSPRPQVALMMLGIAVLAGCGESGTGPKAVAPEPPVNEAPAADAAGSPSVRATVTGYVSSSLNATGWISGGMERQTEVFMISATDSASGAPQSIMLHRAGGGRPGVGTYALHFRRLSDPTYVGYSATYSREANGMADSYGSISGSMTITESTPDRVVGSFQFEGIRFCSRNRQGPATPTSCSIDAPPSADAPRIQVSGTFTAKSRSSGNR